MKGNRGKQAKKCNKARWQESKDTLKQDSKKARKQ